MLRNERLEQIKKILILHHFVKVKELSETLQVTPETIRKDLEFLDNQGEVKRVHGGAILNTSNIEETTFQVRETINQDAKKAIALEAIAFVKEGDCIALDVSTTNTEIIKILITKFDKLSIITNCLTIASIAAKNSNFSVYVPGGKLKNSELCVVGHPVIEYIHKFHIDTFFMSASGLSFEKGLSDYGSDELDIKLAMLSNATHSYAVMDHTKFHRTAMLKICDFNQINGVITDNQISPSIIKKFKEIDIPLFYLE